MNNIFTQGNLHFLHPVPVWKRILREEEVGMPIEKFNEILIKYAKQFYDEWVLELPDEKHLDKSGIGEYEIEQLNNRPLFSHKNEPAVGKWHAVATNGFLNLEVPEVKLLKSILVNDYKKVLEQYSQFDLDAQYDINKVRELHSEMDESWIQFYKDGDYKVLHNHLRYDGDSVYKHIWAGGYYMSDGKPDKWQPYSGRFEFNIRDNRYFVKPEPGLIMMWPGDILHGVLPFYGEEERICVNFNLSSK